MSLETLEANAFVPMTRLSGEIPGPVRNQGDAGQIKPLGAIFNRLRSKSPPFFRRQIGCSGQAAFLALHRRTLVRPKSSGRKTAPVVGLYMVTKGTPRIFFRFFHNPGWDKIRINIGQTVISVSPLSTITPCPAFPFWQSETGVFSGNLRNMDVTLYCKTDKKNFDKSIDKVFFVIYFDK